ncbi:MAG: type II toxin-antitoxin system VapC family toxin [Thermodesulfobacteriota bacterium]
MNPSWIYFDTSSYIKVYVKEKGSLKARNLLKNKRIVSSIILQAECFCALSMKHHRGEIDERDLKTLINQIKGDRKHLDIINLTDDVIKKVESIALNSNTRILDAIHIASALIFQDSLEITLPFITSDKIQYEIANGQGLETVLVG